jgi:hypothetical protein
LQVGVTSAYRGVLRTKLKTTLYWGSCAPFSNQRAPEIVDFTDRVSYEIKTPRYVDDGVEALRSLYQLMRELETQHGISHWNSDLATWYPPHHLFLPPVLSDKIVCTADTTHSQNPKGLILYRIFKELNARIGGNPAEARRGSSIGAGDQGHCRTNWPRADQGSARVR